MAKLPPIEMPRRAIMIEQYEPSFTIVFFFTNDFDMSVNLVYDHDKLLQSGLICTAYIKI